MKLAPNKRVGYANPPKVAAAISLSETEARALSALVAGCAVIGRQVPQREIAIVGGVVARAKKSLVRAKMQRAAFDKERGRS